MNNTPERYTKSHGVILKDGVVIPTNHVVRELNNLAKRVEELEKRNKALSAMVEEIGTDRVRLLMKAPTPPASAEPDMRHPKIQALIGANARLKIMLQIIDSMISDDDYEMLATDCDYTTSIHDKVWDLVEQARKARLDKGRLAPWLADMAGLMDDDALNIAEVLIERLNDGHFEAK